MIVRGFFGIESYDLILQLAKHLRYVGAVISVADCSVDGSLTACIPGFGFDTNQTEFDDMLAVRGKALVDAIRNEAGVDELLVYYGDDFSAIGECNVAYLVTDQQKHNVDRLHAIQSEPSDGFRLIVRGGFYDKITAESINCELAELQIQNSDVLYLEDSAIDYENRLFLQYGVTKKLRRKSEGVRNFLHFTMDSVYGSDTVSVAIKKVRW